MEPVADDFRQAELITREIAEDLRGIPPSQEWQRLLQGSPQDLPKLRAYVLHQAQRVALTLGLQANSWSVGSLRHVGAVLDALSSQLHLLREEVQSGTPGQSIMNEEILQDRFLRREQAKLLRVEAAARRAAAQAKK